MRTRNGRKRSRSTGGKTPIRSRASKSKSRSKSKKKKKSKSLTSETEREFANGFPPKELVAVLLVVVWLCLFSLRDLSASAEPQPSSVYVTVMRAAFVVVIFVVESLEIAKEPPDGGDEPIIYKKNSKLRSTVLDHSGFKQLAWFTHWSWCVLGLYFVSTFFGQGDAVSPASTILWAIAAPNAFLVTVVVSFVIWPGLLNKKASTKGCKQPSTLIMHNANVVIVGAEMFFGSTNMSISHFGVAPLFGCGYVFFSWLRAPYVKPEEGPQYLYDFFDTTLPLKEYLANYLGVLAVLLAFYVLIVGIANVLDFALWEGMYGVEGILLATGVRSIMRFTDE